MHLVSIIHKLKPERFFFGFFFLLGMLSADESVFILDLLRGPLLRMNIFSDLKVSSNLQNSISSQFTYHDICHLKKRKEDSLVQNLVIETWAPENKLTFKNDSYGLMLSSSSVNYYMQWHVGSKGEMRIKQPLAKNSFTFWNDIGLLRLACHIGINKSELLKNETEAFIEPPNIGQLYPYDWGFFSLLRNERTKIWLSYDNRMSSSISVSYKTSNGSFKEFPAGLYVQTGRIGSTIKNSYSAVDLEVSRRHYCSSKFVKSDNELPINVNQTEWGFSLACSTTTKYPTQLKVDLLRNTGYIESYNGLLPYFIADSMLIYGGSLLSKVNTSRFSISLFTNYYHGSSLSGKLDLLPFSNWVAFDKTTYKLYDMNIVQSENGLELGMHQLFKTHKFNFLLSGSYLDCRVEGGVKTIKRYLTIPYKANDVYATVFDLSTVLIGLGISHSKQVANILLETGISEKLPIITRNKSYSSEDKTDSLPRTFSKKSLRGGLSYKVGLKLLF